MATLKSKNGPQPPNEKKTLWSRQSLKNCTLAPQLPLHVTIHYQSWHLLQWQIQDFLEPGTWVFGIE